MKKISVALPVSILREGETFIAYSPALDISTSADTFEKVRQRFTEAVEIFFEETMSRDKLIEALSDLGWRKSGTAWSPPVVIAQESRVFHVPLPA